MKTLTSPEVVRLVEAAGESLGRALYAVAATAGLRRGELLGLRWADVDADRGVLSVNGSVQRLDGRGLVFVEPKTRAGRRQVRLTAFALRELRELRTAQAGTRLLAGLLWTDMDLVFASGAGTPIEEATLTRRFKRDLGRAGLDDMRFHDLRHTAATIMMASNVHPKVVQETLGHANIGITLDTYSHVTPDMQESAVAALNVRYG